MTIELLKGDAVHICPPNLSAEIRIGKVYKNSPAPSETVIVEMLPIKPLPGIADLTRGIWEFKKKEFIFYRRGKRLSER